MSKTRGKERQYQAVIIFNSALNDSQINEEIEKVKTAAETNGGGIASIDMWGKRQLAYKIENNQYGNYVVFTVDGDNALVSSISRQLRINDHVLRFLFVNKDKFAPDLSEKLKEQSAYRSGVERGTASEDSKSEEAPAKEEAAPAAAEASSSDEQAA